MTIEAILQRCKYLFFLALSACAVVLPTVTASGPRQDESGSSGKTAPLAAYRPFERFDARTRSTIVVPSQRYGLATHPRRDAWTMDPLDPSATAKTAPNQVGVGRHLDIMSQKLGKRFAVTDGSKVRVISVASPG